MDNQIEIPVTYRGKELSFKAKVINYGYIHKIEVQLNDHLLLLEHDEEQQYRVSMDTDNEAKFTIEEKELLNEIISVLHSVT